jgi:adenylate cyclase
VVEKIGHGREPSAFRLSPFHAMLESSISGQRWRLDGPEGDAFPLFTELREQGGTDYVARLMAFNNQSAPALRGMAISFTSDAADGFTPRDIERFDSLLPLVGLSAYRIALVDLTVSVLDTYVGFSAGRRILNGDIVRGAGETLTAALLFADLRGFSALAETGDKDLISRLDQHLDAVTEAVGAEGGEVLKFMGDGLLAVFLISDRQPREAACRRAVEAALGALSNNDAVNLRHADEVPLALDVALHCGEVFYGNIGGTHRLDFTVIGPAVNEVARIEALCSELDCPLIMSPPVAAACGHRVRSLGRRTLRGMAGERELFTLVDPDGAPSAPVRSAPPPYRS